MGDNGCGVETIIVEDWNMSMKKVPSTQKPTQEQ